MENSQSLSPLQESTTATNSIAKQQQFPFDKTSIGDETKDKTLPDKLHATLEDAINELRILKFEREKVQRIIEENSNFFNKVECELKDIKSEQQEVQNLFAKEKSLFELFNNLKWFIYVGSIISLFLLPIIALIILYIIDKKVILNNFSYFFNSWLACLIAALCSGFGATWFSFHRKITKLEEEVERLKKENHRNTQ